MHSVTITWASGLTRVCQVEDPQAFLEQQFGHPTRFPEDVTVLVAEEEDAASEEGQSKEGAIGEHPNGDEGGGGREAAEASGGESWNPEKG